MFGEIDDYRIFRLRASGQLRQLLHNVGLRRLTISQRRGLDLIVILEPPLLPLDLG